MPDLIRVLIVDDHVVARYGLRLMLCDADDISVTAEAASAAEAVKLLDTQVFDVALLDIGLPDKSGIELIKQLRAIRPKLAVLMVSAHGEEVYAVRALKQGAAGYLTKNCSVADMLAAVRKAAAGGKYVTPSLLQKLAEMLGGTDGAPHDALSERELAVLRAIASGDSLVRIATTMHLSPSTVTTYRTRILEKMALKSNADLTRYALDRGLIG